MAVFHYLKLIMSGARDNSHLTRKEHSRKKCPILVPACKQNVEYYWTFKSIQKLIEWRSPWVSSFSQLWKRFTICRQCHRSRFECFSMHVKLTKRIMIYQHTWMSGNIGKRVFIEDVQISLWEKWYMLRKEILVSRWVSKVEYENQPRYVMRIWISENGKEMWKMKTLF